MLVCVHKEQELDDVERRFPAGHYIVVDDKLSILTSIKSQWNQRAVFVRQGHYANDPRTLAAYPAADININAVGDILNLTERELLTRCLNPVSTFDWPIGHARRQTRAKNKHEPDRQHVQPDRESCYRRRVPVLLWVPGRCRGFFLSPSVEHSLAFCPYVIFLSNRFIVLHGVSFLPCLRQAIYAMKQTGYLNRFSNPRRLTAFGKSRTQVQDGPARRHKPH